MTESSQWLTALSPTHTVGEKFRANTGAMQKCLNNVDLSQTLREVEGTHNSDQKLREMVLIGCFILGRNGLYHTMEEWSYLGERSGEKKNL